MGTLEFAVWDDFGAHEMATSPMAADVYAQHIREARLAEEAAILDHLSRSRLEFGADSGVNTAIQG
jgi:alkanesulfonate monooxygenase SsuD/methylene tetrahydromethanopterin reductase-like flavin-dependent oxidoreductase (luciferase family)